MAIIEFEDDGISEEFDDGVRLQDVIDEVGADIIFGCREGGCATCLIQVIEGMENLTEPSEAEQFTLEEDELASGLRLACQCTVLSGTVRLRAAGL